MNNISVRVISKVWEAEDIFSFELASVDGSALPPFSAGSHIDVNVDGQITRQYSLCNDPVEQHRYLIGVLRDPNSRGSSRAMHDTVQEGDVIQISAPKNHFPLVPADRFLLFAGGIGITPILCMAERLAAINGEFELHYCTRSIERTAFLSRIRQSSFASDVHYHFGSDAPEKKLNLATLMAKPAPGTHIYVCGPSGFIDHVISTAKSLSWPAEQIHCEYFGAAPQETGESAEFQVQIASSGKLYSVPPERTVIQVLEEHGIDIPFSCEQGVCGTCITRVLAGTPEHRDFYLTDEERANNDQFTPCCSRSRSKVLILDL